MIILASDQAIKAAENSSFKNIALASLYLALGFNVKMLQAYMIVPAVYLTYLIFSRQNISRKALSFLVSIVILVGVSLSWIIAVDLTPTENRPYIGSSGTNSSLELALGNNGIKRLFGKTGKEKKTDAIKSINTTENIQLLIIGIGSALGAAIVIWMARLVLKGKLKIKFHKLYKSMITRSKR